MRRHVFMARGGIATVLVTLAGPALQTTPAAAAGSDLPCNELCQWWMQGRPATGAAAQPQENAQHVEPTAEEGVASTQPTYRSKQARASRRHRVAARRGNRHGSAQAQDSTLKDPAKPTEVKSVTAVEPAPPSASRDLAPPQVPVNAGSQRQSEAMSLDIPSAQTDRTALPVNVDTANPGVDIGTLQPRTIPQAVAAETDHQPPASPEVGAASAAPAIVATASADPVGSVVADPAPPRAPAEPPVAAAQDAPASSPPVGPEAGAASAAPATVATASADPVGSVAADPAPPGAPAEPPVAAAQDAPTPSLPASPEAGAASAAPATVPTASDDPVGSVVADPAPSPAPPPPPLAPAEPVVAAAQDAPASRPAGVPDTGGGSLVVPAAADPAPHQDTADRAAAGAMADTASPTPHATEAADPQAQSTPSDRLSDTGLGGLSEPRTTQPDQRVAALTPPAPATKPPAAKAADKSPKVLLLTVAPAIHSLGDLDGKNIAVQNSDPTAAAIASTTFESLGLAPMLRTVDDGVDPQELLTGGYAATLTLMNENRVPKNLGDHMLRVQVDPWIMGIGEPTGTR